MERNAQLDALLRDATFDDLLRIVARGLPTGPDVEDAVQEAVVRAWLQIEDGRVLSAPKSWIIRTARNLAIDQLMRSPMYRLASGWPSRCTTSRIGPSSTSPNG